ncbi:hypothetical protein AB0D60_15615 [Streptomyces sp. NPDC048306]|uniref:hypothetical protein n=1 Tax=Streptomyces sp. NPDC048306 TaxID=3154502 RepID=UPI0033EA3846
MNLAELAAKLDAYVCTLPGCAQEDHSYDTCVAPLPDVDFDDDGDVTLTSELLSEHGGAPYIGTFVFNMTSLDTRREMRDQASAAAFTAQLRRLADAIDSAAAVLPPGEAS